MADSSTSYFSSFDDVLKAELEFVRERWEAKLAKRDWRDADASFQDYELRGLALSGGGIRSAAFSLGAMQKLAYDGIFDRFHYLSSVSGGGYAACSVSWFLGLTGEGAEPGGRRFGAQREHFPFCGGQPVGTRKAEQLEQRPDKIDGRCVVDYIRQRASYLEPGAGLTILSALAVVLRSVIVSLLGYTLLLALLFVALLGTGLLESTPHDLWPAIPASLGWPYAISVALLAVLLTMIILYSIFSPMPLMGRWNYRYRRFYEIVAGRLLGLSLACLTVGLFFELIYVGSSGGIALPDNVPILAAAFSVGGTIGGILFRVAGAASPKLLVRIAMIVLPPVAFLLLLAGLGLFGLLIAQAAWNVTGGWLLLLAFALGFGAYTDINLTGLHRHYRDRLMETFLPHLQAIALDKQAGRSAADDKNLHEICAIDDDGPYQLINAHVVLLGGNKARYRSRKGDSFVLSRLYSGSEATGFAHTESWLSDGRFNLARPVGPLTLATAMAISGAALNPRTGADGRGITKGAAVSAVLNLLNLRLGYWMPTPQPWAPGQKRSLLRPWAGRRKPSHFWPPNFFFPGLSQGMFGFRHNENASWLELTDGGHFDNTGIYELVRRRVATIFFVDGTTDPEISFASFANALEKIYIDFNVKVEFEPSTGFTDLMKGTGSNAPPDPIGDRLLFARSGFAVATLKYPATASRGEKDGKLFYLKSTMLRELPTSLYSYKATNPLFPSESLADQFFSEQQFEAYRTLGFVIARDLVDHIKGVSDLRRLVGGLPVSSD